MKDYKVVEAEHIARLYRVLATRFHLNVRQENIQRSLDVIEGAYRVLADQAAAWRAELLELMIVLLIVVQIILAPAGL